MLRLPTALKSLEYISCLHYADCVTDLIHLNQSLKADHQVAGMMIMTGDLDGTGQTGERLHCLGLGAFSTHKNLFVGSGRQDHRSLAQLGLGYESPFSWTHARRAHANSPAWNLFDLGLDTSGLHSGYSMYTQINETDGRFLGAHIGSTLEELPFDLAALFEYIMPYLTRTAAKHWLFNDDLLTAKQREIIHCIGKGMDITQISRYLKLPARAVRFHLRKICETTQTESIDEAVQLISQLSFSKTST